MRGILRPFGLVRPRSPQVAEGKLCQMDADFAEKSKKSTDFEGKIVFIASFALQLVIKIYIIVMVQRSGIELFCSLKHLNHTAFHRKG